MNGRGPAVFGIAGRANDDGGRLGRDGRGAKEDAGGELCGAGAEMRGATSTLYTKRGLLRLRGRSGTHEEQWYKKRQRFYWHDNVKVCSR